MNAEAEDLRRQYWTLVVSACEWRAYGVEDPETMAERVFSGPEVAKHPTLAGLFRAIDTSVAQAYANQASRRSSLDALRGMTVMSRRDTPRPDALTMLSSLREGDRRILQHLYWDDLEPLELSEVLGIDLVAVFQRLDRATRHLSARMERKGVATDDLESALRAVRPGIHRRRP